jgi:hypothetical protein
VVVVVVVVVVLVVVAACHTDHDSLSIVVVLVKAYDPLYTPRLERCQEQCIDDHDGETPHFFCHLFCADANCFRQTLRSVNVRIHLSTPTALVA